MAKKRTKPPRADDKHEEEKKPHPAVNPNSTIDPYLVLCQSIALRRLRNRNESGWIDEKAMRGQYYYGTDTFNGTITGHNDHQFLPYKYPAQKKEVAKKKRPRTPFSEVKQPD